MVDLEHVRRLGAADHGLVVVSVARADGSVASSVVNAGVLAHPVDGSEVLGFVIRASAFKRRRLLVDNRITVTFRVGWEWQAVEGSAELIGPLEPGSDVDVPKLLRDIFVAAGGIHDDWSTYDSVMVEEQRTAVLVAPQRVTGVVG